MYGLMSPTSPEALRHETSWVYSQGAPPVFKGDLYYYSVDHDLTETAEQIDTSERVGRHHVRRVRLVIDAGDGEALAERIPGAVIRTCRGSGTFR